MLLKEIPKEFRSNHVFRFKHGVVEYQCKVTYLPFSSGDKAKYKELELENIYTPLIHLEWKATNIEKSIYQSHFIMPYSVIWWFENRDETAYDKMVNYAAVETGYFQRIKEENRRLQTGIQLAFF